MREGLQLRLSGELTRFTDDELKAVVGLLSGPGVVWELKFGSWVLLQPGRINAYAQAVIQTMRADEHERGCLAEERVLGGDLTYHRPDERLPANEERTGDLCPTTSTRTSRPPANRRNASGTTSARSATRRKAILRC